MYYVPPVTPATANTSTERAPQKHEKPKKENLLSRAADAIVDFLGFEDD